MFMGRPGFSHSLWLLLRPSVVLSHTHTHRFYRAVVQSVLLFGSETWVLSERMLKMLESFHNRCARFIARDFIQQRPDGSWQLPHTAAVLNKCDLETVHTYITKRKQNLIAYATRRPIYTECIASTPTAMNANQLVWWDIA